MIRNFLFIAASFVVLAAALFVLFFQSGSPEKDSEYLLPSPHPPVEGENAEVTPSARERIQVPPHGRGSDELAAFEPMDRPGWRVCGEVMDRNGKPLGGSTVAFQFEEGDEYFGPVAEATTGDDGVYTVCLPVPVKGRSWPFRDLVPSELVATARLPGYFSEYGYADLGPPDGAGKPFISLDFVLDEGANVHGRVVTPYGRPVDFADIFLCRSDGDFDEGLYDEFAYSNPDGTWAARVEDRMSIRIIAFKDHVGTTRRTALLPDPPSIARVPDLVLDRFGVLEGVIRNSDGRPAEGFDIQALPESLVDASDEKIDEFVEEFYDTEYEIGDASYGETTSGTGGRFSISGLREGRYCFRVFPGINGWEEFLVEVPRRLFQTGDRFIELVQPFYTLMLRLVDHEGNTVPRASLGYECTWKDMTFRGHKHNSRDGCIKMLVAPTTFYFDALGPGSLRAKKAVTINEGDVDVEATLYFYPIASARISFHYAVEGAVPADRIGDPDFFLQGECNRPLTPEPVLERCDDPGSFSVEIPPDYYRIWVKPGGTESFFLPVALRRMIRSGDDKAIRIPLRKGGRLTLTVLPSLDAGDWSPVDRLVLLRKNEHGKWRKYGRFARNEPSPSRKGLRSGNGMVPLLDYGETTMPDIRCSILEEGEYRLKMHRRGWNPGETDFRIVRREVAAVELRLERRER